MFEPGDDGWLCGYCTDFPNGLTVSVQWHNTAYAECVDGEVISVEIACWLTDDRDVWMTRSVWGDTTSDSAPLVDDVIGWVPVEKVEEYLDIAEKCKPYIGVTVQ